ncbi:hypothetical protein HPULCUR_002036 [Helicostylum pulchrum]|uniref:Adhesin domain-containing protein n=1 Tax=Helicostylum pulchrum TaxID=562976 RepID=A0ABP9XPG2_9FUNG
MSNPKSFYNQADYSAGSGSRAPVIHKPDEVSASDLLPPPPYSPDPARKSSDSTATYGSTEQQQVGLLSQQSQPFPSKKIPHWSPTSNTNSQSSTPRQDHASIPVTFDRPTTTRRRANGDPGCCRKWCKYLFAAILIWLVLLLNSDKIGLTPPTEAPPSTVCANNPIAWHDIPRMIDFDQNVEFVLRGRVTGGRLVLTPLEDRHGGTIFSEIQFTPSSLDEQMKFNVEQRDGTTVLTVTMPDTLTSDECINLNMEIRLPYSADFVRIDAANIDVLVHPFVKDVRSVDIQTSNGKLDLDRWSGESIKLVTSNSEMNVGNLIAGSSIFIQNSNEAIHLSQNIEAKKSVDIRNTNGLIEAPGKITADDYIKIKTSNDFVQLGALAADDVYVQSSNRAVKIESIVSKVQVNVQTSNGPIDLSVAGEKNNRVVVSTSSESINLHMAREFEGHFVMSTSNGPVVIENDNDIKYQDNLGYLKRGEKGTRGKGDLTVTTSNSDIYVAFDV